MSAKRQSKVLCQRAVPYELYKGLTFTTIWLEVIPRKKMLEGLCLCRAFFYSIGKLLSYRIKKHDYVHSREGETVFLPEDIACCQCLRRGAHFFI